MSDDVTEDKITCFFILFVLIGGMVSFFANFWYIFVPIIVIAILIYKKLKK